MGEPLGGELVLIL